MTCDVCKVLRIKPDTFRQRIYSEYYPEYQKIGVKRIFTLEQIKDLIKITEGLIRKGEEPNQAMHKSISVHKVRIHLYSIIYAGQNTFRNNKE
jgi:hypothetical protein